MKLTIGLTLTNRKFLRVGQYWPAVDCIGYQNNVSEDKTIPKFNSLFKEISGTSSSRRRDTINEIKV